MRFGPLLAAALWGLAACGVPDGRERSADAAGDPEAEATGSPCEMPPTRIIREDQGAIIEVWEVPAPLVASRQLPTDRAFLDFRRAVERAGAGVRLPASMPPTVQDEETAAIWRDEEYNVALVYERGAGSIDPISCLDALLFARQAARVSAVEHPTEFLASVLRRETPEGTIFRAIFSAGSDMFVPKGFYGFDQVRRHVDEGWDFWYAIHSHPLRRDGDDIALGMPLVGTSDVRLMRSLGRTHGLEFARVTNGFFTFQVAVDELEGFRWR